MAWLQAAPKKQEGSKVQPQSPSDRYPENDPIFIMPPADEYIAMCFRLIGVCKSSGMGVSPLDYSDVKSFVDMSGFSLGNWQAEQVVAMSRAYCSAYSKYTNSEKHFAPWVKQLTSSERATRNKNIADAISRSSVAG